MITPIQYDLNNPPAFGALTVERIRVPRKSNSADSTSFSGNYKTLEKNLNFIQKLIKNFIPKV